MLGILLIGILLLIGSALLSYKTVKSLQRAEENHGKLRWSKFWFHLFVEFLLLFIVAGIYNAIKDGRWLQFWLLDTTLYSVWYSLLFIFPAFLRGDLQHPISVIVARVIVFGLVFVLGYGIGIVTQSPQSVFLIYPMFMFTPMIAYGASVFVAPLPRRKRTSLAQRMLEASALGFAAILILQIDFFLGAKGILILIILLFIAVGFRYKHKTKQKNDIQSAV
jgi:hypothetical protein